jgi:hypothetical protein
MADVLRKELEDLGIKLGSAREAAAAPGAGEREKSDLRMIEQEYLALENRLKREGDATGKDRLPSDPGRKLDRQLDEALKSTFPGSDPVSFVEAAPLNEADADLTSVKATRDPADRRK